MERVRREMRLKSQRSSWADERVFPRECYGTVWYFRCVYKYEGAPEPRRNSRKPEKKGSYYAFQSS